MLQRARTPAERPVIDRRSRYAPSASRTAATSLALAMALGCAGSAAQVRLPDFGDSSESVFSGAAERELGERFMREIRASMTIVEDPEVGEYIQDLGYKLVSSSDRQSLGFNFFVVNDSAINAFAAPGGWVGVNAGLIAATESESELASVVAHEVAHVTQRHIARFIERNERSSLATLAGILAAIAIGTQNSQAGQAAAAAVIGTQAQMQLDFSRDNEKEADHVGMQLLDESGFDPAAMATFFEKLQSAGRYYRRPPEFLSTHPVTTSRIAEARDRAAQFGFRQRVDGLRYGMVRAKVRVLMESDNERLLAEFNDELPRATSAVDATGVRYGMALVKARMGRLDEAREQFEALAREHPDVIVLRMAVADTLLRSGKDADALAMFRDAWHLLPDSRLVARHYAEALLRTRQPEQSLAVIEEHRRLAGADAELMRLQAQALQALGRTAQSQAALAEHYYRKGELDAAIHQLTLAAAQPENDYYHASRIEARLEELRREHAERTRR
jgi:predicted Zn-dependent protease